MTRSGRLSLGGNTLSKSRLHIRSPSGPRAPNGNKRRVSFGGMGTLSNLSNDLSFDSNNNSNSNSNNVHGNKSVDPKKDSRRAMLEEWRAQNKAKEANKALSSGSGSGSGGAHQYQRWPQQQQHYQSTELDKENNFDYTNSNSNSNTTSTPSRPLPLPPSSSSTEGTTAVERFRMRRLQRERRALGEEKYHPTPPIPPSADNMNTAANMNMNANTNANANTNKLVVISSSSSVASTGTATTATTMSSAYSSSLSTIESNDVHSGICMDDDPVISSSGNRGGRGTGAGGSSSSTPMFNRRMTMSGGSALSSGPRRRAAKGRKSLALPPTPSTSIHYDVENEKTATTATNSIVEPQIMENMDTANNNDENITSTAVSTSSSTTTEMDGGEMNEPGLRSRIVLMEKRIHQLEKEKMTLSMSKAPLEARLRQKEDQWSKEQSKYELEINSLMVSSKETNDKLKSMEMQFEELQEENTKLRFEARKKNYIDATESADSNDVWSRQLQNDRDVMEYKDKLHAAEEEIKALRLEKVSIESEVNATNMELSALVREFDDLQEEYEELSSKKDSNAEAEIQLEELKKEHTATTAQLNATSGELASLKSQSKFDMEMKEKEWQEKTDKLLFDMSVLQNRAGTAVADQDTSSSEIEDEAVLKARIEERDRRIAQLEAEVLKGEQIRRQMHNRIQELRGNIRVYVRTRPFLPGDNGESVSSIDVLPDGESLSIEGSNAKTHEFKFDKVFAPSAGQKAVFDDVSEFVQSALDGYHVCLFSYGQTGSGKTHTMQGSGNGGMRGIIPRAVEQILNQVQRMKEQKWKFNVTTSFLEIYNEELRDLLVSMNGGKKSKSDQAKLTIRREKNGKSYVSNLKKIEINTEEFEEGMQGLKAVMASAARARSVACTKMNSVSSRSHSVFMLHLSGMNEESGTMVQGALNLCDLAGSERLDRSGAGSNAQRLKETQSINKSLSCLGDVFTALSNGSSHVPYRNSKLTYLLQDCLSGDGKALMFVNLSPTQTSSNESLCSLRFAQRVNQVELGKATKHVQYRSGGR